MDHGARERVAEQEPGWEGRPTSGCTVGTALRRLWRSVVIAKPLIERMTKRMEIRRGRLKDPRVSQIPRLRNPCGFTIQLLLDRTITWEMYFATSIVTHYLNIHISAQPLISLMSRCNSRTRRMKKPDGARTGSTCYHWFQIKNFYTSVRKRIYVEILNGDLRSRDEECFDATNH